MFTVAGPAEVARGSRRTAVLLARGEIQDPPAELRPSTLQAASAKEGRRQGCRARQQLQSQGGLNCAWGGVAGGLG